MFKYDAYRRAVSLLDLVGKLPTKVAAVDVSCLFHIAAQRQTVLERTPNSIADRVVDSLRAFVNAAPARAGVTKFRFVVEDRFAWQAYSATSAQARASFADCWAADDKAK